MKKSSKIIVRVMLAILLAYAILMVSSYAVVAETVKKDKESQAKTIVGIYADLVAYEAERDNCPVDKNFAEKVKLYGDYICFWYVVDSIYMFVPDTENDTIEYIAVSRKEETFGDMARNYQIGNTVHYRLSEGERLVWDGGAVYAKSKNGTNSGTVDHIILTTDSFGNKVLGGISMSSKKISNEIYKQYAKVALMITLAFVVIVGAFVIINRRIRLLGREQERQKTELEIAANIQKGFLEPSKMFTDEFEIKAIMSPAKDVGGDLYDYAKIDENKTLIVIADISGKGVSAAMFMSVTLMLIKQYAKSGHSPKDIAKKVNDVLSERNPKMLFSTAFISIYDKSTGELTYSNAGHNVPYLLSDKAEVIENTENTLLGLFQGEDYTEKTVKINKGELLFLFTDGVNEATNGKKEFYGSERLERVLNEAAKSGKEDTVEKVFQSVKMFTEGTDPYDDITMLSFYLKDAAREGKMFLDVNQAEFPKIREVILQSPYERSFQLEMCLAAEEIFTNICFYGFPGGIADGEKIEFSYKFGQEAAMCFKDGGVQYNPTIGVINAEDYDIDSKTGGLGKMIAFSSVDKAEYEYKDSKNILKVTKTVKENENDNR